MKKQKFLLPLIILIAIFTLFSQACTGLEPVKQNTAEREVEAALPTPTEVVAGRATETITKTGVLTKVVAVAETEIEQTEIVTGTDVDVTEVITETEVKEIESDMSPTTEVEDTVEPTVVAAISTSVPPTVEPTSEPTVAGTEEDETEVAESKPFTATTGLSEFSSYRMTFTSDFEGTRQGQPTSGSLAGLLEATKSPEAQHLRVEMKGDTFRALAPLGNIEIYDINGTFYLKNPQDGKWIGVPAFLVDSMLPTDMYNPEDSIELPVTAVPHADTETINGILAKRYTFGPEDMAGDGSNYEEVDGTIWVAVDGDYVVRYEAMFKGQFDNLVVEDMALLDEGTITMMYELSEVDGSLTLAPPEGAVSFDLTKLLFK